MLYVIIGAVLIIVVFFVIMSSKPKDCKQIMEKYYEKALSCFDSTVFKENAAYELVPLLYVIGDLTLVSVHKDRMKYARQVAPNVIPDCINDKNRKRWDDHMAFYAHIVQGGYLWGGWSLSDLPSELKENPLSRCMVACGDLINDPECIEDYENAPLVLCGITEKMKLNQAMIQLSNVAFEYCKAVDKAI
ncbi:MAG: hypothetical protein IJI06_08750 [Oscillospiraceae bacterium]|nr:hypothetical protein [Oscillospiraceae bacterium]